MQLILLMLWLGGFAGRSVISAEEAPKDGPSPPAVAPGHSMSGEAFNEGPRQKAYLMDGLPALSFSISSPSADARRYFVQGISQLHGFWYFEAERSFRQAASFDPSAAMPYWGMAVANIENEKRARGFVAKAMSLRSRATRRESLWIEAFDRFYREKQDDKDRRKQLVRDLEEIINAYPGEIEAKAFLAWIHWANSQKGIPIQGHQAINSLLEDVERINPLHPGVHHYRIHLWDNEKAERALGSAATIGKSAPAIAHQWHMAGHIYSKLKRYDDSSWQQEASARVDHEHMMRDGVMPYQIHNYAHNNQWLATDLAHQGRVESAVRIARNLVEIPRHPTKNHLGDRGHCVRQGRERLLEILPRFELWDELIQLAENGVIEPGSDAKEKLKRLKALGVAWYAKGDVGRGDAQVAAIQALKPKPPDAKKKEKAAKEATAGMPEDGQKAKPGGNQPDSKKTDSKNTAVREESAIAKIEPAAAKTSDKIIDPKTPSETAKNESASKSGKLEETWAKAELDELAGWRLAAQQSFAAAFEALEKCNVRKAHLAMLALRAGKPEAALKCSEEAVNSGVNEVDALATRVFVLHQLGRKEELKKAFAELRALASRADLSLPCMRRIDAVAVEQGISGDWRQPSGRRSDFGSRPLLESLGPECWSPVQSRAWRLSDAEGREVGSETFRGRPVAMIFFLGAGCLHCVEQLEKFGAKAADFEKAGIAVVAVSTDTRDEVRRQIAAAAASKPIPFPVLSDSALAVFQAYRAFDDFEKKPLHGTFLIDAGGKIRWQDIGADPFADVDFLLKEADRLLHPPAHKAVEASTTSMAPKSIAIVH